MMLPAGLPAEKRHVEWSDDLGCFTVRCMRCAEDWPCTEEYYRADGRGPSAWCKACYADRNRSEYHHSARYARRHAA